MDLELLNTMSAKKLEIMNVNIPMTAPLLNSGCDELTVSRYNHVTSKSVVPGAFPPIRVNGPPPVKKKITLKLLILPVNVVMS